jgi:hypothetical protein
MTRMADGGSVDDMRRAIANAAKSAGMKAPVVANKNLTTMQDTYESLNDKVRKGATEMQDTIESMPHKYEKGQRVFTKDSAKKNKTPYTILYKYPFGGQPMREDHPKLPPGNGIGKPIKDPATGKTKRTPYEPGYKVRSEQDGGWSEFHIPESAIVGKLAAGGSVKAYSPLDKLVGQTYAKGGSVKGGSVKEDVPRETTKAYKLFRVHPKHPGKLFPLFVDANTPVEMGKWINAKEGEMAQGKVKSKIGPLAYRPGWHAGDLPIATHIGGKSDPTLTAPNLRPENHAWAEIEMPNDVDWQTEATKRGTNAQGKLVPVKAHITDQIPVGGHYRYKTNPNMTGNWLIGGSMKVNRVLTDNEVAKINKAAGLADLPRAQPFNKKEFGFAKGGEVHSDGPAMGINVRSDKKANLQYADLIVDGHKTYESRNGDTLRPYVGKRVSIVRTGDGPAKAIGAVTVGEPMVVDRKKFREMEQHHLVPEGSAFDIASGTKHLYPMHEPERYESERDVGHGIVARKVLAHGGNVSRGTIKGKVTMSSNMDVMRYELHNRKAK